MTKHTVAPTNTETPTPAEDLVRAIYRLGAIQRQIARHALDGLGGQGFSALGAIHMLGPIRISDVAHRLGVDLSVASRQVGALVEAGYARREVDEADRRAHLIATTPEGVRVLKDAHGRMVEAFAGVLADWDVGDVSALTRALTRLRDDFEEGCTR